MAGRRPNPNPSPNPKQVKQFLSHLDLEMLFQNVPTLCHLDMTYGVKSIGAHAYYMCTPSAYPSVCLCGVCW